MRTTVTCFQPGYQPSGIYDTFQVRNVNPVNLASLVSLDVISHVIQSTYHEVRTDPRSTQLFPSQWYIEIPDKSTGLEHSEPRTLIIVLFLRHCGRPQGITSMLVNIPHSVQDRST